MRKILSVILIALLAVTVFAVMPAAQANYVTYEQFGAVGDGVTCDFDAIIAAHDYANANNLPVRANSAATYFIGAASQTAQIQTNTDWTGASFIIDNSNMTYGQHRYHVFRVTSRIPAVELMGVDSLYAGQENIDITLQQRSLVIAHDANVRQFIRRGPNANQGSPMVDVFIVDENGSVDPATPIIWDFEAVTSLWAHPIDAQTLTITGGNFTTVEAIIPNIGAFLRGINVTRSNVVIDGLRHQVIDERPGYAPPNRGILNIHDAAYVTVQNVELFGRIVAQSGSYDLTMGRAVNTQFINVWQGNCIHDRSRWGITGASTLKNVVYDNVTFSRVNVHAGAHNKTIRNSTLGHQGINLMGSGTFLLENTTVHSWHLINLRSDFGSSWNGDMHIINSTFVPIGSDAVVINAGNDGRHWFGYETHMPRTVTIDGLVIDDAHLSWRRHFPHLYTGPNLFSANHEYGNDALCVLLFWDWLMVRRGAPYATEITQEVILLNIEVTSGRRLRLSRSLFEFRNVNVIRG